MQQAQISRDIIGEYLKTKTDNLELAKTDRSYRRKMNLPDLNHNMDLGTLGDAVLCLGLTQILFEMGEKEITEKKKLFESDEILVTHIGKYYDILKILKFDDEDKSKQHGYAWASGKNSLGDADSIDNHAQKFIATAVEACLGAFYLDNGMSMKLVLNVVSYWMCIIEPELISNSVIQKYLNPPLN